MPSCCGGGTSCGCVIQESTGTTVEGSGTLADPFIISANVQLAVLDTQSFNLTLTGTGTPGDPNTISVNYAATAKLDHLPDVNASAPTNGQVLSWNSSTSQWVAGPPATAASGSVIHDSSLVGDGSIGFPLTVKANSARFVSLPSSSGIGLTDAGINQLVRGFADTAARTAASPVPDANTLSMLDTAPGQVDFWDAATTTWKPIRGAANIVVGAGQFMSLSGPYVAGGRVTQMVKQVDTTTDAGGVFDVLTVADLNPTVPYAGVLSVQFQEVGAVSSWKAMLYPNSTKVSAVARKLSDGTVFASQAVKGTVMAWLYGGPA